MKRRTPCLPGRALADSFTRWPDPVDGRTGGGLLVDAHSPQAVVAACVYGLAMIALYFTRAPRPPPLRARSPWARQGDASASITRDLRADRGDLHAGLSPRPRGSMRWVLLDRCRTGAILGMAITLSRSTGSPGSAGPCTSCSAGGALRSHSSTTRPPRARDRGRGPSTGRRDPSASTGRVGSPLVRLNRR